jgi:hypothetical protein
MQDLLPLWRGRLDRRAIAASLHHAILIGLDIDYGIGDPDAGAYEQRDDRKRKDVHQHALPIIDRFVRFPFKLREMVGRLGGIGGMDDGAGQRRLTRGVPERQHLSEVVGTVRVGLVVGHLQTITSHR